MTGNYAEKIPMENVDEGRWRVKVKPPSTNRIIS
jgi:hypothetical protein